MNNIGFEKVNSWFVFMGNGARGVAALIVAWLAVFDGLFVNVANAHFDYRDALTKSLIFLEAQRSIGA